MIITKMQTDAYFNFDNHYYTYWLVEGDNVDVDELVRMLATEVKHWGNNQIQWDQEDVYDTMIGPMREIFNNKDSKILIHGVAGITVDARGDNVSIWVSVYGDVKEPSYPNMTVYI